MPFMSASTGLNDNRRHALRRFERNELFLAPEENVSPGGNFSGRNGRVMSDAVVAFCAA